MFQIEKSDLLFEAGFERPDFALSRDMAGLLQHLFGRLEAHGLRLNDLRIESGAGSVSDFHVLCYLFNYWMTVRIRVERVEIACSALPQEGLEKLRAATVDVLRAIRDHRPELTFRAFSLAVAMHGRLEGVSAPEYLGRFASNAPKDFGPLIANGAVFYYGPDAERLLCALTLDASALVPDGVYVRIQGTWDGKRVTPEGLPMLADALVRQSVERLGLQLPR
jgi:hypothetical protein